MTTVIDLSALGTRGFIIQGATDADSTGFSVSGAGDVNGDGFDDVIVGALYGDGGGNYSGAAYVIFGKADGFGTIDLGDLAPADGFAIRGEADQDQAGRSVSAAGDINGDGFADVIVGARYADEGGSYSGAAYVIFGKAGGFATIDVATLAPPDGFVIQGDGPGDQAGSSVSDAGDVNGDGFADLIVGARFGDEASGNAGTAHVIFGKAGGFGTIDLGALAPADGFVIRGDATGDNAGTSVSAAGDINGDGFADLIVGAPLSDDGGSDTGQAYVIFGKASGFATIDVGGLAAADGFLIQGDAAGDGAGITVSAAGDVNGDGFDDMIVGAYGDDDGGTAAGAAYVIFGKAGGFGTIDLGRITPTDGFAIQGDTGDQAARSVASAGDVNGDGFADLIVGAPLGDRGGYNAGEAYVIFGKADGFGTIDLAALAPADGFVIQGDTASDIAGISVSGAGDVNGDGFDDLIVGAYGGDDGGNNAGEAYVIFGGPPTTSVTRIGSAIGQTIRGGIGDDTLDGRDGDDILFSGGGDDAGFGGAGDDSIDGAGGDDMLSGGSGNDTLFGGIGTDSLSGGSGNDRLDGGRGGNTLVGGSGNDTYIVSSIGDRVVEDFDSGTDTVRSAITYTLGDAVETLTLTGRGAIDGTGNMLDNAITGNAKANVLSGDRGNDTLTGGRGNDALLGGDGNDRLDGGTGKDVLTGGTGADQFRFDSGDSVVSASLADVITDFSQAARDQIDLSRFDAIAGTPATDAFDFIGAAVFSGAAGELRYRFSGGDTLVSGDTDGDAAADFTIRLTGSVALVNGDFVRSGGGGARFAADADAASLPAQDFAFLRSGEAMALVHDLML